MGSPYVQLLNQINCFEAANLTDPQKGKKTKTKLYQKCLPGDVLQISFPEISAKFTECGNNWARVSL